MTNPIVLIVPGLRDHAAQHWQTWLAEHLPLAHSLTPMGRENLSLDARIADLEATIARLNAPVLLVAHSGGCVLVAHWACQTALTHRVCGALLATPPTFDRPLPPPYPQLDELDAAGWLPVPRPPPCPFPRWWPPAATMCWANSMRCASSRTTGAAPSKTWAKSATSTQPRALDPGHLPIT